MICETFRTQIRTEHPKSNHNGRCLHAHPYSCETLFLDRMGEFAKFDWKPQGFPVESPRPLAQATFFNNDAVRGHAEHNALACDPRQYGHDCWTSNVHGS